MVHAANTWSKRDLAVAAAAVALQVYAARSGFGGPCALLLLCIAPFVFGREAWQGETSAYSVFNGGRRIAGTFTAEQFDAQLRGGPRPVDPAADAAAAPRRPAEQQIPAPVVEAVTRRRAAAEAAERRAAAGKNLTGVHFVAHPSPEKAEMIIMGLVPPQNLGPKYPPPPSQ